MHPKDKLSKDKVVGPVYHIPCTDCSDDYVGESERSLKARFHKRPSTTSSEVSKHLHSNTPPHTIDEGYPIILKYFRKRG